MPRRVSLPGADELFRTTGGTALQPPSRGADGGGGTPQSSGGRERPEERPRPPFPAEGRDAFGAAPGAQAGPAPAAAAGTGPDRHDRPAAGAPEHSGRGSGTGAEQDGRDRRRTVPEQLQQTQANHVPRTTVAPRRPGQPQAAAPQTAAPQGAGPQGAGTVPAASGQPPRRARQPRPTPRRPSGRERHDEKITVYVSAEELMDLEHARLVLRGEHGLAVDRGRIVREAVAVVLADLEARGDASILVRRLRGR
ncbi:MULTISPECIES: hypothetical protein [Streptomyces]|uniref:hypothetical protein n=1 Tax=Streptomyces TaxID=1883 RepID=UPI00217546D6|nr:hypothetical protein [Streptomyces sp. SCUT-3]